MAATFVFSIMGGLSSGSDAATVAKLHKSEAQADKLDKLLRVSQRANQHHAERSKHAAGELSALHSKVTKLQKDHTDVTELRSKVVLLETELQATSDPTPNPTGAPTEEPTQNPTERPTDAPSADPTQEPTQNPTGSPTNPPTDAAPQSESRFDQIRAAHKSTSDARQALELKATPVQIFTNARDVTKSSALFTAMTVSIPDGIREELVNRDYYAPHMGDMFCASVSGYLTHIQNTRIKNGHIDKTTFLPVGPVKNLYGKCVVSRETLPLISGTGIFTLDNMPDEQKKQDWIVGGTDYGDWYRLDYNCNDHKKDHPPLKRTAKSFGAEPDLVYAKDAVILREGSIHTGSEDGKYHESYVPPRGCYHTSFLGEPNCRAHSPGNLPKHGKVFVLSQVMGENYFHFMVENLPKVAIFLKDLLADKEVQIHIVTNEDFKKGALTTEKISPFTRQFMDLLGVDVSRFVSGDIVASEVFIPPGVGCGTPGTAFFSENMLRETLMSATLLSAMPREVKAGEKPIMLVMTRYGIGQRGANLTPEQLKMMVEGITKELPDFDVQELADTDKSLSSCQECMVKKINSASVIVAEHGAGLSNILFAKAGTTIIEMYSFGLPPCYLDLAYTLGLNYYNGDGASMMGALRNFDATNEASKKFLVEQCQDVARMARGQPSA
jgi:hypothetical protein